MSKRGHVSRATCGAKRAMTFNSFSFLIFFPLVTALFFAVPHRFRWLLLLTASCCFYMFFIPVYILILVFTILVDYVAGLFIENARQPARRWFLIASIVANVGALAFFKYCNFLINNVNVLGTWLHTGLDVPLLNIVLPIGLSFHTFQAMSYTIEVYRGKQKAERHLGIYALYVMFYPQLVAGPIERPQNLLHQFREVKQFDYERVTDGLKLMAFGMFKKVVIADRLAQYVNLVYGHPADYCGVNYAIATLFFAFQIYFDFSGYSDIAIGAARVMGFSLMQNFRQPYFSKSIGEFWTRWHISLSTWFRDYVYIPLGGNRVGRRKLYRNLLVVFVVSGLWHGANWTYVIWGALNGLYLAIGIATANIRPRIASLLRLDRVSRVRECGAVLLTFSLICLSWVFFRANNLHDALYILAHLGTGWKEALLGLPHLVSGSVGGPLRDLLFIKAGAGKVMLSAALVMAILIVERVQYHGMLRRMLMDNPVWVRWPMYFGLVYATIFLGAYDTGGQFIYFQF